MSYVQPCSFGISDLGLVRQRNEDQFLIADLSKTMVVHHTSLSIEDETRLFSGTQGQLLLVADGMGGHAAGDLASALTVDTITQYVLQTMPWFFRLHHNHEDDLHKELITAVMTCQQAIHDETESHPEEAGMGTTLTMAYVIWPRMYVVHVGDSRCYVLREGKLQQITRDQTYAQLLVDEGAMDFETAQSSPLSHLLISSIGQRSDTLHPDVYQSELQAGDTVVLCTDGLTNRLSDEEIVEILQGSDTEDQACHALVDAANVEGGCDNITVVVSRYVA